MIANFKDFMNNVLVESLHPELQTVVQSNMLGNRAKQTVLAHKVRELTQRGEPTGIEGNMPKGSSRAWLQHTTLHEMHIDGVPSRIPVGTKVAIRAPMDVHHNKTKFDGLSLGELQNRAENDDGITDRYRILEQEGHNHYRTNKEQGIFPPLIDYDDKTFRWAEVGHCGNVTKGQFKELTKTPNFPQGITHDHFVDTLMRDHDRDHGKYYETAPHNEAAMDKIETHPLVEKFLEYHRLTGTPPHDYQQIKNMGIFTHPDGSQHIVARDHGFDSTVEKAYQNSRAAKWNSPRNPMRPPGRIW